MPRPTRSLEHRRLWRAPAVALVVLAGLAGWLALSGDGGVRYAGVARVELPLPSATAGHGPAAAEHAAATRGHEPAAAGRGAGPAGHLSTTAATASGSAAQEIAPAAHAAAAAAQGTTAAGDLPAARGRDGGPAAHEAATAAGETTPAEHVAVVAGREVATAGHEVDQAAPRGGTAIGPAPIDVSLIEDGPFGPLPRIGPDGRRPFFEYARPFNFEDARPKVAVLLLGLGLQAELFDAALALPGPISLELSPYAPDLPALVERARRGGHEVLLHLPTEPADYPTSDPGPHALLAANAPDENLRRLSWLLARAPGYIALAGGGAAFAGSEQVDAVLDVLARRGLALVELGAGQLLQRAAAAAGLPYANAPPAIDQDPSLRSIDEALAGLEAKALRDGSALGVVPAYPLSLERLRAWSATLDAKGLVLAPVSAVLIEQAGLARGANGWPARRGPV